jgi:hypothetical protein
MLIKRGLLITVNRVLDACEAIQRVTGETFAQTWPRHLLRHPLDARERGMLIDLWRL